MSKLMQKFLLAFFVAFVSVAAARAASTKFTNLEVTGNLTVDGTTTAGTYSCSNNTFTSETVTTSNITQLNVSTGTFSGAQGVRMASGHITAASTVPAAAGILATDSSWNVYISTGTGAGAWVKVGGQ